MSGYDPTEQEGGDDDDASTRVGPAIIFTVVYFILTLFSAYQLVRFRSWTLLYVTAFVSIRVLTFAFRAKVAENDSKLWQTIAGLFLAAAGFFILVNTLFHLLARINDILLRLLEDEHDHRLFFVLSWALRILPPIIACSSVVSGAGSILGGTVDGEKDPDRVYDLRRAGALMYLGSVFVLFDLLLIHFVQIWTLRCAWKFRFPDCLVLQLRYVYNAMYAVGLPATIVLMPRVLWQCIVYYYDNDEYLDDDVGFYLMFASSELCACLVILNPYTLQYSNTYHPDIMYKLRWWRCRQHDDWRPDTITIQFRFILKKKFVESAVSATPVAALIDIELQPVVPSADTNLASLSRGT